MWTVVYLSQNKDKVDRLIKILNSSNIMTMLKVSREDDYESGTAYEILVPQTELESAQDIIFDTEISG